MLYRLLADSIVAIHIGYVFYIVIGVGLIFIGLWRKWRWIRNPWFRLTHFAAILIPVSELIFKTRCVLTVWEFQFRSLAGQPVTETTFMERLMHYVFFAVAPAWLTNGLYYLFALIIILMLVLAPLRWRRSEQFSWQWRK
jgi:hypothetical protein